MAQSTEPNRRIKLPGESTTNPSFASPQINTAPDIRQSQKLAGIAPIQEQPRPTPTATPTGSVPVAPPTTGAPPPTAPKAAATAGPTVTSAAPAPAAATVPASSGAPPGVPETTPPPVTVPTPPTPKALEGKNAAENEKIQAENEYNQKVYEAALAYNGGPTSALEEDKRRAEAGLRTSTANRGSAGTIESSLYGEDKDRISTAKSVADLKAYDTYQKALITANNFMNQARTVYEQANEKEKKEIAEAAERREQTERVIPTNPTPPAQHATPVRTENGRVYFSNGMYVTEAEYRGGVVPYEEGGVKVGKR